LARVCRIKWCVYPVLQGEAGAVLTILHTGGNIGTVIASYPKEIRGGGSEGLGNRGLYDRRYEHDSCGVGFVVNIKGRKSHSIIEQALEVLRRLAHRGAVGADPGTGDGAGILMQIPHEYYARVLSEKGTELPEPGSYGTGLVFLPSDEEGKKTAQATMQRVVEEEGGEVLAWRVPPVTPSAIGETARQSMPEIGQVFVIDRRHTRSQLSLEQWLYFVRKRMERAVGGLGYRQTSSFYITNLSSRTVSYKGMLTPHQVQPFFEDLRQQDVESSLALIHSRYSTNTLPSWNLAQPFRFLAHNGEINTLRGNINWMKAREGNLASSIWGDDLEALLPVIVPEGSDSACLDNLFELLVLSGRPLSHAMMMLIPPAWELNRALSEHLRDFYRYHACFMEPWDGPAAIAYTDGRSVGAVLDRNGLRPARYIQTRDDTVVMASEVGVLDIPPARIIRSGRLEPGRILYIDTEEGRVVEDEEIKQSIAARHPYGRWISDNVVPLKGLPRVATYKRPSPDVIKELSAFGYTREDLKMIIKPMAETGSEPVGSMGTDTPHAVLSQKSQVLFNYFRQLFAQVTNPAIDPIREDLVMSLESYVGVQQNILDASPRHCHKLKVEKPILTDELLSRIQAIRRLGFRSKTISTLFDAENESDGESNFIDAIDRICREAEGAVSDGYAFVVLSDRRIDGNRCALPSLLATGAVHHHLVKKILRTQIGIIVESGEPREVHHFALLLGFGADCVNPYMAYEAIEHLSESDEITLDPRTACNNYIKAVNKGLLKILSKMGISTLNSYRGAQIFEALGLSEKVVDRCFTGMVSRIGGLDMGGLAKETLVRHREAFRDFGTPRRMLPYGGVYHYRRDGEFHLWNPDTISALQDAVRRNDYGRYKDFAGLINDQSEYPTTLRSLFRIRPQKSIPLEEVEAAESIWRRFATGAMSYGSISINTHETIAGAMNRIGGKSNTGEGGEDPARFYPRPGGINTRSAIKQVASGRFGVTTNYLVNSDEMQIKIAQGAKPGEGGQLPGYKVSAAIARTRYTTAGVTLISPPPHHDIYSIEDLKQLIFDLKNVNPRGRVSVKLVSEIGVGTVAAGVAKGNADVILISGGDGGTGASPRSSIRYAGLPWELGLAETHQVLLMNGLRSRVILQTDGQLRTGRDVAIAAMLGAEEFGFATAALVSLGCVLQRHCHLNTCSIGVATQDELLCRRFRGRVEHLVNFFSFLAQDIRENLASLGIRTLNELVGRTDLLQIDMENRSWKSKNLDLSPILYNPRPREHQTFQGNDGSGNGSGDGSGKRVASSTGNSSWNGVGNGLLTDVIDRRLVEIAKPALEEGQAVSAEMAIKNTDRTTGALLSGEVCQRYGEHGLVDDSIHIHFRGQAGQSFGAWLARGVTFELEGMSNDYIGKGLSGGKLIVYPDRDSRFRAERNIIIGNTTFYGAISGEAYIRGLAGERFCIRNSGLYAVVEGVGDHGCEYMTGGRVVVLGSTGRNFAAGMSGGIAYVYDAHGELEGNCNISMVELEEPDEEDRELIHNMLQNHRRYTGSPVAEAILDGFDRLIFHFVKIVPLEYRRIVAMRRESRLVFQEVSDG
jgi:glutamate synthase domain-containing protein 2/glutamate synthase domain-containing protein 1/glutamate synthase domain-containing protein 3